MIYPRRHDHTRENCHHTETNANWLFCETATKLTFTILGNKVKKTLKRLGIETRRTVV
jgi:hypothetical protein